MCAGRLSAALLQLFGAPFAASLDRACLNVPRIPLFGESASFFVPGFQRELSGSFAEKRLFLARIWFKEANFSVKMPENLL